MPRSKSVAQITKEVMLKYDEDCICLGSIGILDEVAKVATHTKLNSMHPLDRHIRIMNYLETSKSFEKKYIRLQRLNRLFCLIKD